MPGSSNLIFLGVGQWGQFLIVDKPYKNMLSPRNSKTASKEKGVLRQMGTELHYRAGGLRGREIGELFQVGDRSVSQERRRLKDWLSDDRKAQDLFKGFLGKCNDWRIDPVVHLYAADETSTFQRPIVSTKTGRLSF